MVLDVIFGFLLNYTPVVSVTIFAIIVLFLINIFYKILIDQNNAKQLKARTKEISSQMKEAQKAGDTKKSGELLSEMMRENNRLMRMTMKPMIISFIIVILMLPFLATHYGDRYAQLNNGTGTIGLDGVNYTVALNDNTIEIEGASLLEGGCDSTCYRIGGRNYEVVPEKDKVKFAPIVAVLPIPLPVIGTTIGWLGWYILVSIPFVMLMRKFMRIYV